MEWGFSLSRGGLRLLRAKEMGPMLAVAKGVGLSKDERNISYRSIIGWDHGRTVPLLAPSSIETKDSGLR